MKPRRVRFTETANRHVDRERAWWLENRDHQNLFAAELEKAIEILALSPELEPPTRKPRCPTCDVSTSGSWAATCTTRSTHTTSSFEPCGADAGSADRRSNSPSLSCLVRLTVCRSAASGGPIASRLKRVDDAPLVGCSGLSPGGLSRIGDARVSRIERRRNLCSRPGRNPPNEQRQPAIHERLPPTFHRCHEQSLSRPFRVPNGDSDNLKNSRQTC